MSNQNYTLDIISHHPKFSAKSLRKYYVDGIETVGAWGDEPFEIKFKNNTWQKVQVKLSVDGTDILSGDKASTDVDKNMWVVNGYGTLSLKAWPENSNGGAAFVFTSANNSVAIHTHGDLSNRGIIAAAIFIEGHVVEPIRYNLQPVIITQPVYPYYDYYWYNNNQITCINSNTIYGSSMDCSTVQTCSLNSTQPTVNENLAAVGAGSFTPQQISHVAGLIKPTFTETVRVKYMWWDLLVEKLKNNNISASHASGFPGDKKQQIMSLGNTPRLGQSKQSVSPQMVYSRI